MKIKKLKILTLFLMAFFVFGCVDKQEEKTKPAPAPKPVPEDVKNARENLFDAIKKDIRVKQIPVNAETVNLTVTLLDKNNLPMIDAQLCAIENSAIICVYERALTKSDGKTVFKIPKGSFKILITYNPWVIDINNLESVNLAQFAFIKNNEVTYKIAEATEFNFTSDTTLIVKADIERMQ